MKTPERLKKLPNFQSISDKKLRKALNKKGYFFVEEIDQRLEKLTQAVLGAACTNNVQPIYLLINSEGGAVQYAWALIHALRSYPGPTIGVVVHFAGSASFDILQACQFRFALPGASAYIHGSEVRAKIKEDSRSRIDQIVSEIQTGNNAARTWISERSGVSIEGIKEYEVMKSSFALTPQTKFIDAIIPYIPPFKPLPAKWQKKIEKVR